MGGLRPIIRLLRLDHHVVLPPCTTEVVLQQTMPGQPPDQSMHLLIDVPGIGGQCAEWQTRAQVLRALCCGGTEFAQPDRMGAEAGGDLTVGTRFENHVRCQPGA